MKWVGHVGIQPVLLEWTLSLDWASLPKEPLTACRAASAGPLSAVAPLLLISAKDATELESEMSVS